MSKKQVEYPIYRKYKGIDVWFKISSNESFEETKIVGSKVQKTEVKATIFPELQFIQDMINCLEGRWEVIDEKEYKLRALNVR